MSNVVKQALDSLRTLGTVDELRAIAGSGARIKPRPAVNAHIHLPPNFSAFESVAQAVNLAADQNVGVLGASNYYDFSVYADFVTAARQRNIFPLFGLEIIVLIDELLQQGIRVNDPGNPGRMYLCGLGITRFDEPSPTAARTLTTIRDNDRARMAKMVAKVAEVFLANNVNTALTADAVIDSVVARHNCPRETVTLQERHVAMAFQQAFFKAVGADKRIVKLSEILATDIDCNADDAIAIQGLIRSHLMKAGKPAYIDERFVSFNDATNVILELGGIPCYPVLADGAKTPCEYEQPVETLIDNLTAKGIHCVELIPIRNDVEVLTHYVTALRDAGFLVMSGTEHNTLSLLPIEPTCVRSVPVPEAINEIFREGASVVAAHQFLTLNGQPGFLDATGQPNAKIEAFATLGEAVIQRYYETNDKR